MFRYSEMVWNGYFPESYFSSLEVRFALKETLSIQNKGEYIWNLLSFLPLNDCYEVDIADDWSVCMVYLLSHQFNVWSIDFMIISFFFFVYM
jgi:hypothetical protein